MTSLGARDFAPGAGFYFERIHYQLTQPCANLVQVISFLIVIRKEKSLWIEDRGFEMVVFAQYLIVLQNILFKPSELVWIRIFPGGGESLRKRVANNVDESRIVRFMIEVVEEGIKSRH